MRSWVPSLGLRVSLLLTWANTFDVMKVEKTEFLLVAVVADEVKLIL